MDVPLEKVSLLVYVSNKQNVGLVPASVRFNKALDTVGRSVGAAVFPVEKPDLDSVDIYIPLVVTKEYGIGKLSADFFHDDSPVAL